MLPYFFIAVSRCSSAYRGKIYQENDGQYRIPDILKFLDKKTNKD